MLPDAERESRRRWASLGRIIAAPVWVDAKVELHFQCSEQWIEQVELGWPQDEIFAREPRNEEPRASHEDSSIQVANDVLVFE